MTQEQQSRVHAQDVVLHDLAETKYLMRRAVAAGYGMNPDDYVRPFPGTTNQVTVNRGGDWRGSLGMILLAAAIGGGGLGIGGLCAAILGGHAAPIIVAPGQQSSSDVKDSKVRLSVLWKGKEIAPGTQAEAKVRDE